MVGCACSTKKKKRESSVLFVDRRESVRHLEKHAGSIPARSCIGDTSEKQRGLGLFHSRSITSVIRPGVSILLAFDPKQNW